GNGFSFEILEIYKIFINSLAKNRYTIKFPFEINRYKRISIIRGEKLSKELGFKSFFQFQVHKFMLDNLGIEFISEKRVRAVINDINKKHNLPLIINKLIINNKAIQLSHRNRFDGFFSFTSQLKNILGIDNKLEGIVYEAQGNFHTSWKRFNLMWSNRSRHDFDRIQALDEDKRIICQNKNIVLIEIHERWERSKWADNVLEQFNIQTGTNLKDFSIFKKYSQKGFDDSQMSLDDFN
ncbi:hypothetical protein LCGC14_1611330, partial [marine sediment metagenome]